METNGDINFDTDLDDEKTGICQIYSMTHFKSTISIV